VPTLRSLALVALAGLTTLAGDPAPSVAQPAAPAASQVPEIAFEKYTLPNGLEVILHVDRKLPIVHVNQWYHVGSKNEKPGRTGFAHLFEHMMFQGSKNVPGEYFSIVEELGANLQEGGVNGTTDNDRTNYFATVPSGNLETLLWLESDRLATLLDGIDEAKLANQRDVVKNERRQGLENQPYGRWWELLAFELFPYGHPYSWPVIGSMADLTAASLDDVKEFFRTYYTPNNLSLVIAGDFDPAEAKRLVEKYFGPIPPGPALSRPKVDPVVLDSGKAIEVADRVPQERVYLVYSTPALYQPVPRSRTAWSSSPTPARASTSPSSRGWSPRRSLASPRRARRRPSSSVPRTSRRRSTSPASSGSAGSAAKPISSTSTTPISAIRAGSPGTSPAGGRSRPRA
jgi:zinc protease